MDSCREICTDLQQLQELVRNKVGILLGLVQKLPNIDAARRVSCLNAILGLEESISIALIDLEKKCGSPHGEIGGK